MVSEVSGDIVEVFFTPGQCSDVRGLRSYRLDLPQGSTIYADKAYCDYGIECTAIGFLDHTLKEDCATIQSH